jgi:hypothetical protein
VQKPINVQLFVKKYPFDLSEHRIFVRLLGELVRLKENEEGERMAARYVHMRSAVGGIHAGST